jgi:cell division protein FtsQ
MNCPAVDSANVYLSLDGKLHLDILQRVPVFRLNNGGKGFYVDKDGTEFPISKIIRIRVCWFRVM